MKNLFLKTTGILLIGLFSSQSFANTDVSKSTNIRADLVKDCVATYTKDKVLTTAEANKFCKCNVDSQAKLTQADIWEMQSAVNAKKNPESLPVSQRVKKEMETCAGVPLIAKVRADALERQKKYFEALEQQQKKK